MGWDINRSQPRRWQVLALLAAASITAATARIVVISASPAAHVIDVPAGGSLQQALNAVQPGGTVRLAAGATYTGSFTLPAKNGTEYILITTANVALPPPGVAHRSQLQAGAGDDSIRQHELRAGDRAGRQLLPHRGRGVRGEQERFGGHHRARSRRRRRRSPPCRTTSSSIAC